MACCIEFCKKSKDLLIIEAGVKGKCEQLNEAISLLRDVCGLFDEYLVD